MPRRRNLPPFTEQAAAPVIVVRTPGVLVEVVYVDELPPATQAARRWFAQRVFAAMARDTKKAPRPVNLDAAHHRKEP